MVGLLLRYVCTLNGLGKRYKNIDLIVTMPYHVPCHFQTLLCTTRQDMVTLAYKLVQFFHRLNSSSNIICSANIHFQ